MTAPGDQLGSYVVRSELGRGAMGVVYLAHDARLDRTLAIKTLPPEFAAEPTRLARFQREARVVAGLSHPNIAAVYGLESSASGPFIAMEYVEGPTLADRLVQGPLPVDDALAIGAQIAAGVEAAHEAGVIHRDLKPANIKITAAGKVKVLDFGLAREAAPLASTTFTGPQATLPHAAVTNPGVVMGTIGYMAPEQARGKVIDRRVDIFAFGCVLFEMLAGRSPFTASTSADTLAAILERDPDLKLLPARTPTSVRELVARCLEKDPAKRLRDIGDARLVLQDAVDKRLWSSTTATAPIGGLAPSTRRRVFGALIAIAGVAMGTAIGFAIASRGAGHTAATTAASPWTLPLRVSITFPDTFKPVGNIEMAPDGRAITFLTNASTSSDAEQQSNLCVAIRRLDQFEPQRLRGTEHAINVWFTTDSQSVIIRSTDADDASRQYLSLAPLDGSALPVRFYTHTPKSPGAGGWLDVLPLDYGEVLITDLTAKEFIRVRPGQDQPISRVTFEPPEHFIINNSPSVLLPDQKTLLIVAGGYDESGWAFSIFAYDLNTGKLLRRVARGSRPYVRDGVLLWWRDRVNMAAKFDVASASIVGDAVAVTTMAEAGSIGNDSGDVSRTTITSAGTMGAAAHTTSAVGSYVAMVDAQGVATPLDPARRRYANMFEASLDGSRFLAQVTRPDELFELWGMDVAQSTMRRILSIPGKDIGACPLSPTGDRAMLAIQGPGEVTIRVMTWEGATLGPVLFTSKPEEVVPFPNVWTPDGKSVIATVWGPKVKRRTIVMDAATPLKSIDDAPDLLPDAKSPSQVNFTADGRWMLYGTSNDEQGVIMVARWKDGKIAGKPVRVPIEHANASTAGFAGSDIWVRMENGSLMKVPFKPSSPSSTSPANKATNPADADTDLVPEFGKPVVLLSKEDSKRLGALAFSALPDGRQIAVINDSMGSARIVYQLTFGYLDYALTKLKAARPLAGSAADTSSTPK